MTPHRLVPVAVLVALSLPAAAEPLRVDADQAVQLTLAASHLVAAADARLGGARATVAAADAERRPLVAALASLARQSSVPEYAVPLGGPGTPAQTLFPSIETTGLAGLELSQVVYAGGAVDAGRAAARAELAASEAERARTAADLAWAARSAYWQAVAASAAVAAAASQEERAAHLADDTAALRLAGMAVAADELAAAAHLAAARLAVIRAESDAATASAALASLLGAAPGTSVALADRAPVALPPPPAALAALLDAAAGRPELAATAATVAALASREQQAAAGRRPALELVGRWDLARPNPRYLPPRDEWNDSWQLGVAARWTLFDGDRVAARTAELAATRSALEAERGELERRVALEVESARLALVAALAAAPATDAALAAARAREEAARERHAAGLAPTQEMLDAQTELADAELAGIRARAAAWLAAASLERAVAR